VLHGQSILPSKFYLSCDVCWGVPDVWLLIVQPRITCYYFFLLGSFWTRLWSHSIDLNVGTFLDTNRRKMLFYKKKKEAGSRISPRRSLLPECYTFAGCICKCNFFHIHEESMELLFPIVTKRTNAQQHYVQVSCTKFHQNRSVNLQSIYNYVYSPLSKAVPLCRADFH
jgi:hypothetical protein